MPNKPQSPCAYPGCPKRTGGRYCAEHQKQVNSHCNHFQREPETNKRYGRAWKKLRRQFLEQHPLCAECEKIGRIVPATEVHHIKPLTDGGTNDRHNLMALCKACHSRITLESTNLKRERWV